MQDDRKARLKALREEALAANEAEQLVSAPEQAASDAAPEEPASEEPVLKFRNYAVKDDKLQHIAVEATKPAEFEEVAVDLDAIIGNDPEEVSVVALLSSYTFLLFACTTRALYCVSRLGAGSSTMLPQNCIELQVLVRVAPKKANWDLRRDIAPKLAKLERMTQRAMVQLMQQEEARRQAEEDGA
jgi:coiled-coil domain-containing protein 12